MRPGSIVPTCVSKSDNLCDLRLKIVVVSADMALQSQCQTIFIVSIFVTILLGIFVGIFAFYTSNRNRKKTEAELIANINSKDTYRAALGEEFACRGLQMRPRNRIVAGKDVKQGRDYKELKSGIYSVKFSYLGILNPILTPMVIIFNEIYLVGD